MGALVAYCSQTGSAKTYADWLAEDLGCPCVQLDRLDRDGADADLIVLCTWFHAASMKGSKQFKAYMAAHPEKRYGVVGVGATPMPCDEWPESEIEEAFRRSFPVAEYPDLPWCYCQGNFHFEKLGALDKIAMRIYFRMLESQIKQGETRQATALQSMREGFDGCDRRYLKPFVERLKKL